MGKRYDVLGVGISSVDDLFYISNCPDANCKLPIASTARRGGGPACTAMAAVGALQGKACYLARLGTDDVSQYVRTELNRQGVDIEHIIKDSTAAPYHCIIVVDQAGNRMVLYDSSLYRVVNPEDIPDGLLQSTSVLLLDHLSEPAAIGFAEEARRLGIPTVGDIEGQSESALQLAALIDYLIVPEDFALWASGESRPEDACARLAETKRMATIVTGGAKGCHFCTPQSEVVFHIPAFEISVFDTTGCGDVFHGAFAFASARSANVPDAIVFASAAAALKANAFEGQKRGWDALPTAETVFLFLQSRLPALEKSALLTRLGPLRA